MYLFTDTYQKFLQTKSKQHIECQCSNFVSYLKGWFTQKNKTMSLCNGPVGRIYDDKLAEMEHDIHNYAFISLTLVCNHLKLRTDVFSLPFISIEGAGPLLQRNKTPENRLSHTLGATVGSHQC